LTLARLDTASAPPQKTQVSLLEILQEVVADAQFEAQERGSTVALAFDRDCVVQGSPELLHSAIENVVRNAVRYTDPGTSVHVSLACASGPSARITVRDHGAGVPDSELGNLFRPFYRVASARERSSGGTGLGLAITQRALRLHGGIATARNVPGAGLEVDISIPSNSHDRG
jgi:two-component system, OmpR family, sensor histidine kinase CpxA